MTMENIKVIQVEDRQGNLVEHIVIEYANGSLTSMLKSTWDELEAQREQSGTL
jgi:hypothetical protein